MARRPLTPNGYANPILPNGTPRDPSIDQIMTTPGALNIAPNPLLVRNDQRIRDRAALRAKANADAVARQAQLDAAARARASQIVNGKGGFGLGLGLSKAQQDAARAALAAGDPNRAWDLMSWNRPDAAVALTRGKGSRARVMQALFPKPKAPKGDPGSIA